MNRVYALMRGSTIFTLKPCKWMPGFRFIAFRDGSRCGFFKTKKAFEEFVANEPENTPLGPHADAAFRAEAWSTFEGLKILQQIADKSKRKGG